MIIIMMLIIIIIIIIIVIIIIIIVIIIIVIIRAKVWTTAGENMLSFAYEPTSYYLIAIKSVNGTNCGRQL